MRSLLSIFCILFSSTICADNNPLIGEWISSKEKTINYANQSKKLTKAQLEALNMVLGKVKYVFTENKAIVKIDGTTTTLTYEVVEDDKAHIKIKLENIDKPKMEEEQIFYFEDNYLYQEVKDTFFSRDYFIKQ